ncbi:MAG: hypothetical protein ABI663_03255 [Chryseolinea sp.]
MKKIINNSLALAVASMLTLTSYAQMADNSDLLVVTDQKQSKNRPAGLDERVTIATDQPVEFSQSLYGYTASYMLGDTYYMATYDNQSHYIDTYKKIDWNDAEVSSLVKSALLISSYKGQEVTSYWESSNPSENGFYLEVKDKSGKLSSIWADAKGNFYDRPYDYEMKAVAEMSISV